jgi:hypothetical protein
MGTCLARGIDSDHLSMVFPYGLGVTTAGASQRRLYRPPSARNFAAQQVGAIVAAAVCVSAWSQLPE